MLVQGAPVTSEIELLVDVNLLVPKDFKEKSGLSAIARVSELTDYSTFGDE